MENDSVFVGRRDHAPKDKKSHKRDAFVAGISDLLSDIQDNLLSRARAFQKAHTKEISSVTEFESFFTAEDTQQLHGGFASTGFCCDPELEDQIAKKYKVSVRCIPNDTVDDTVACVFTGKPGKRVIFAKSY